LNWEEVVEMSKNNISFGAHTKSHVYLPSITDKDVLWEEISGSKKTIETHIVSPSIYFCYPTGGFTEEVLMLVKKAGYKGACSTNRGSDLLNKSNVYELKRISIRNIDPDYSFSNISDPVSFRAKLTGYYNIFKKAKKGH
jgi:peptidoglycan/xylan/chitin deacetylase (PgdA/CDA1 family)